MSVACGFTVSCTASLDDIAQFAPASYQTSGSSEVNASQDSENVSLLEAFNRANKVREDKPEQSQKGTASALFVAKAEKARTTSKEETEPVKEKVKQAVGEAKAAREDPLDAASDAKDLPIEAATAEEPADTTLENAEQSAHMDAAPPDAVDESEGKRTSLLAAFFSPTRRITGKQQEERTRSLFQSSEDEDEATQAVTDDPVEEEEEESAASEDASASPPSDEEAETSAASVSEIELPGVRSSEQLFGIVRKSEGLDDSNADLYEQSGLYHTASAAGLARLAPNGLLTQHESVDVTCLKPALVRMLKTIERHYGKRMVVTSGYRSPAHNRRVRGARRSLHMSCSAADVQIEGVTRWELARFARSLPGRGGVGTYCHTKSVHVDVGPERDWNWSCR